ncbi:MAG: hypothetical protein KBD56_00415 [Candidatus Eisenbacteria bacterium]|nr:hypothetical protein [Candidatus Eisenbacteria bacterium]
MTKFIPMCELYKANRAIKRRGDEAEGWGSLRDAARNAIRDALHDRMNVHRLGEPLSKRIAGSPTDVQEHYPVAVAGFTRAPLARMIHEISAATSYLPASTALRWHRLLDVLRSTPVSAARTSALYLPASPLSRDELCESSGLPPYVDGTIIFT